MQEASYQLFTQEVLELWKEQEVSYIKVEELTVIDAVTFFELIPDSELLDDGSQDTLYSIDSEDVDDMLLPNAQVRFLVHRIYLDED